MVFLGGHNIDFSGGKKDVIDRIGFRLSHFKFENPHFFINYERSSFVGIGYQKEVHANDHWQFSDFSLGGIFGLNETRKVFAIIGPYSVMLRVSNTYIEFMTPIYSRQDWYSPANSPAVSIWRDYFRRITGLMGGTKLLYITQVNFSKYHDFYRDINIPFLEKVEVTRQRRKSKIKPFEDYGNGKYPPYFIETVKSQ
jgi:hypothetical protein